MYHTFFIHSSVSGHLGAFYVLAIVESAAVNIGVHDLSESWFSPDRCPGVGLLARGNFRFLRNLHTVFHSGFTILKASWQITLHPLPLASPPTPLTGALIIQINRRILKTLISGMNKPQGPVVKHRKLYSISGHKPYWRRMWTRTCVCVTESLCWTAEHNTTL